MENTMVLDGRDSCWKKKYYEVAGGKMREMKVEKMGLKRKIKILTSCSLRVIFLTAYATLEVYICIYYLISIIAC